jgi:hypothetical protein
VQNIGTHTIAICQYNYTNMDKTIQTWTMHIVPFGALQGRLVYKEEGVPCLWALFISKGSFSIYRVDKFFEACKKFEEDIYMNFCFELNIKVCCMHGGCRFGMHELVEVYVSRVQGVESR